MLNKKNIFLIAITYTIFVYVICLISIQSPVSISINHLDKLVHLAIYFIFTLVWFVYFYKATMGKRIVKSLVKASIFAFCAGVSIEILQKILTKNRSADLNDILANSIGIAIAAVLLYQLQKYNKLNSLK